jgi:hypothetical protein
MRGKSKKKIACGAKFPLKNEGEVIKSSKFSPAALFSLPSHSDGENVARNHPP